MHQQGCALQRNTSSSHVVDTEESVGNICGRSNNEGIISYEWISCAIKFYVLSAQFLLHNINRNSNKSEAIFSLGVGDDTIQNSN